MLIPICLECSSQKFQGQICNKPLVFESLQVSSFPRLNASQSDDEKVIIHRQGGPFSNTLKNLQYVLLKWATLPPPIAL
jgi:hypothetical protein